MGRVVRLPEHVANQIAAGEVVERPASVVKELVENALDAGARRISVEVEEGGQRRIRVTDDGFGMSRDDALASLERHATSKIRCAEDLARIATLGFRGEALPSIASVSRFRLVTRSSDDEAGTRITVLGGSAPEIESVGAPPGTTVDVDDLFFNVPARRKFLKRPGTETGHVTEALARLALCQPDVAFEVRSGSRVLLRAPPNDGRDPRGRLGRVLGNSVAERLDAIPLDDRPHAIEVRGFAGEPGLSDRTRRSMYTFVNGRFVRDRTIQHAVLEAYRGLVEPGRFPVVVLHLTMDSGTFDVNVHPQKTEIRLRSPSEVHRAVVGALGRTLTGTHRPPPSGHAGARARAILAADRTLGADWALRSGGQASPDRRQGPVRPDRREALEGPFDPGPRSPGPDGDAGPKVSMFLPRGTESLVGEGTPPPRLVRARPRPLGLAGGRYLAVELEDALRLIDLRAVLEQQAFIELSERDRGVGISQRLLVPRVVELGTALAAAALDLASELAELGFEVEDFGGGAVAIVARPAGASEEVAEGLLRDLITSDLDGSEGSERHRAWARRAARARVGRVPTDPARWIELLDAIERDARLRRSLDGRATCVDLSARTLAAFFEDLG